MDAGPLEAMAALVALPSTLRWWLDQLMPPGMRALGAVRTAAVAAGAAKRGPVDAALGRRPRRRGAAGRATGWPTRPTAVCLVARAAARRRRAALRCGGHRRWRLHGLAAGAVLARVLPLDGAGGVVRPGGRPSRTTSWPALAGAGAGAPGARGAPSRRRTSTSWRRCSTASTCPPAGVRRAARGRAPRGRLAARPCRCRSPSAAGVRADPLGRRPGGHRRRRPPVAAGSTRCCAGAR